MSTPVKLLVNSKDRTQGYAYNFRIQPYPRYLSLRSIELLYAYIPFQFKNVTAEYGFAVTLRFQARPLPSPLYELSLELPFQYYSTTQLITYINQALSTTFPPATLSAILSLDPYTNKIRVSVTGSITAADVEFSVIVDASYHGKTHVFYMLGLPTSTHLVGVLTAANSWSMRFPYPFSQEVPFKNIIVNFLNLPRYLNTTTCVSGSYLIDISAYRPAMTVNGSEVVENTPIVYKPMSDFRQVVVLQQPGDRSRPQWNITDMDIELIDENGKSIAEHVDNREWSMLLEFTVV